MSSIGRSSMRSAMSAPHISSPGGTRMPRARARSSAIVAPSPTRIRSESAGRKPTTCAPVAGHCGATEMVTQCRAVKTTSDASSAPEQRATPATSIATTPGSSPRSGTPSTGSTWSIFGVPTADKGTAVSPEHAATNRTKEVARDDACDRETDAMSAGSLRHPYHGQRTELRPGINLASPTWTNRRVSRDGSSPRAHVLTNPLDDGLQGRPRREDAAHSSSLEPLEICVRNDATAEHHDVIRAVPPQLVDDCRKKRIVGAAHDRETDGVYVLLDGRGRDHLRGLVQAGVNDLETGVAKRSSDDLRPSVVPV